MQDALISWIKRTSAEGTKETRCYICVRWHDEGTAHCPHCLQDVKTYSVDEFPLLRAKALQITNGGDRQISVLSQSNTSKDPAQTTLEKFESDAKIFTKWLAQVAYAQNFLFLTNHVENAVDEVLRLYPLPPAQTEVFVGLPDIDLGEKRKSEEVLKEIREYSPFRNATNLALFALIKRGAAEDADVFRWIEAFDVHNSRWRDARAKPEAAVEDLELEALATLCYWTIHLPQKKQSNRPLSDFFNKERLALTLKRYLSTTGPVGQWIRLGYVWAIGPDNASKELAKEFATATDPNFILGWALVNGKADEDWLSAQIERIGRLDDARVMALAGLVEDVSRVANLAEHPNKWISSYVLDRLQELSARSQKDNQGRFVNEPTHANWKKMIADQSAGFSLGMLLMNEPAILQNVDPSWIDRKEFANEEGVQIIRALGQGLRRQWRPSFYSFLLEIAFAADTAPPVREEAFRVISTTEENLKSETLPFLSLDEASLKFHGGGDIETMLSKIRNALEMYLLNSTKKEANQWARTLFDRAARTKTKKFDLFSSVAPSAAKSFLATCEKIAKDKSIMGVTRGTALYWLLQSAEAAGMATGFSRQDWEAFTKADGNSDFHLWGFNYFQEYDERVKRAAESMKAQNPAASGISEEQVRRAEEKAARAAEAVRAQQERMDRMIENTQAVTESMSQAALLQSMTVWFQGETQKIMASSLDPMSKGQWMGELSQVFRAISEVMSGPAPTAEKAQTVTQLSQQFSAKSLALGKAG